MSLARISHLTYELRHNPNCRKPYLIVTCGKSGIIERENPGNLYSSGTTLDEAVTAALADVAADTKQRGSEMDRRLAENREREHLRRLRWEADRHRNLVWA